MNKYHKPVILAMSVVITVMSLYVYWINTEGIEKAKKRL